MPIPTLNKFADKIKQRKQFKDRKDKKKSALNYIEKKWQEAEDIVTKQYGKPGENAPKGKFYGTLMKILKNKLHVNENLTESPDKMYGDKNSRTFVYWQDKDDFTKDMKKVNIHPEGFIEEEKLKFPLLLWIKKTSLMANKKKIERIPADDHGTLFHTIARMRKGSTLDNSFDGRDLGTNSGRLDKSLISFWGNKVNDDMIRFIIDTVDVNFNDEIEIETPKRNTRKRRYEGDGDISTFRIKDEKQEKRMRTSVSPIDAVRARRYPGLKFESKFDDMYNLIMEAKPYIITLLQYF